MPIKIIDRLALGRYQALQLENAANITIRTGVRVGKIEKGKVHTSDGDYGYQFLVGADGATSVVRRYLRLASRYTIGMYYDIPDISKHLIVYLDGKNLGTGYIWEFPHQQFTNVGIHFDPARFTTARARDALHAYMNKKQYRVDAATYRAFLNRIFLAGDAAGLACKLTGEGISYALISGREVARKILNSEYRMTSLDRLVKRKKKQEKIVHAFEKVPAGLDWFYNLFLKAIKYHFITYAKIS
jgi:geranylgeranyl reductase